MSRRKKIRKKFIKRKHTPKILLDQFSVENIQKGKVFNENYRKYHWDYYKELAYQRSKIADKLRKSLLEALPSSLSVEGSSGNSLSAFFTNSGSLLSCSSPSWNRRFRKSRRRRCCHASMRARLLSRAASQRANCGAASDVPAWIENPPLARALFASMDIDDTIPAEHFKAVAEVIGFVMRLKKSGGGWRPSA